MVEDNQQDSHTVLREAAERLAVVSKEFQLSGRIGSLPGDRFASMYYNDTLYRICLPLVEFEPYQQNLLRFRHPVDLMLLTQLFDLVPDLGGKSLVDVGGFTGFMGHVLATEMNAGHLHVFEPQKVAQEGLRATIAANNLANRTTFYSDVIDEDGRSMMIADARPDRLSRAYFICSETGTRKARSLDSFDFDNVGLVNLDYNASKVPALRGAEKLLTEQRPVVLLDLPGRDTDELKALLEGHGYLMQRAGRYSAIFLPT